MEVERNDGWRAGVPLCLGYAAIVVLIGGIGLWSLTTEIVGAVVAGGAVKMATDQQVVQHPDGGVVREISAKDGDVVTAGDVVLRFDDTFLKSELSIVEQQLLEIFARRARLSAERDNAETLEFGEFDRDAVLEATWLSAQLEGQKSLFDARRVTARKEIDRLREQGRQAANAISGVQAQITAMRRQLVLVKTELQDQEGLRTKGLGATGRLIVLGKEQAELEGEIGRLTANTAELKGKMAALEIEQLRLLDKRREDSITQIRDLRYGEIELLQRRDTLRERLARLELRAPVSGTIFGSTVFAVNSVVQPGAPITYVVPGNKTFVVAVRVETVDVDQVYVGQEVTLKFSAFDQRTTPDIRGTVQQISADAFQDKTSGTQFYQAVVQIDAEGQEELLDLRLMPGMPVEAFIKTDLRTPFSYLTRPLAGYFGRSFREG